MKILHIAPIGKHAEGAVGAVFDALDVQVVGDLPPLVGQASGNGNVTSGVEGDVALGGGVFANQVDDHELGLGGLLGGLLGTRADIYQVLL